ncbi:hypothetical protein ZWY2020_030608 [Hordeum vulgare]|nr:hypothetical protein ZWY2020_030608 [Hordeum vulgare]
MRKSPYRQHGSVNGSRTCAPSILEKRAAAAGGTIIAKSEIRRFRGTQPQKAKRHPSGRSMRAQHLAPRNPRIHQQQACKAARRAPNLRPLASRDRSRSSSLAFRGIPGSSFSHS